MTAVDHAELKRCPFCGSAAKLETYGNRLGISCTECLCRTPLGQPGEDLTPVWNLRTPDAALLSEIEGLKAERDAVWVKVEDTARRYARCYPEASDGRNTFVMFAEWAASQAALRTQALDSWRPDREAVDAAIRAADEEFGGMSSYRRRVLTDAILALRPQTAESGE